MFLHPAVFDDATAAASDSDEEEEEASEEEGKGKKGAKKKKKPILHGKSRFHKVGRAGQHSCMGPDAGLWRTTVQPSCRQRLRPVTDATSSGALAQVNA